MAFRGIIYCCWQ